MAYAIDMTGEVFKHFKVIKRVENTSRGQAGWLCRCNCGNKFISAGHAIRNNKYKSCGCVIKTVYGKHSVTHGMTKTSEYKIFSNMKNRCYRKENSDYKHYGGRGIKVCKRWLQDFQNFYNDMGPRPSRKHSIERKDVNGDYKPSNCYWATMDIQQNNKTNNLVYKYKGMTKTVSDWAKYLGISRQTLYARLYRGLSFKEAVSKQLYYQQKTTNRWG